jgi:hypothetical protein
MIVCTTATAIVTDPAGRLNEMGNERSEEPNGDPPNADQDQTKPQPED